MEITKTDIVHHHKGCFARIVKTCPSSWNERMLDCNTNACEDINLSHKDSYTDTESCSMVMGIYITFKYRIWKVKANTTTRFRYDTAFKSTDREEKMKMQREKKKKRMGKRNTKHPRTVGSLEKV